MPTTARNARNRRKIEMVAPKLLIWGVPKPIYFMNAKSMVLRKDDEGRLLRRLYLFKLFLRVLFGYKSLRMRP